MSSTSEPKAFIGAKSRFVWGVWLFAAFGLLLDYFPLGISLPDFGNALGSGVSVAGPTQPEKVRGTSEVSNPDIPMEVVNAPMDSRQLFFDNGAKEVRCDVPVGSWSAEVVTLEEHRDYSWDVKPDNTKFYVRFADGHIEQIGGGAKRFKDVSRRRGVMRFYGTVPGQKAVVKLE